MSTIQAFEVGLAAEKKACDFYDMALSGITDPEVMTLFTELRDRCPNTSRCYERKWPNYPRALASRPRTTPMMRPIYRAWFTIYIAFVSN